MRSIGEIVSSITSQFRGNSFFLNTNVHHYQRQHCYPNKVLDFESYENTEIEIGYRGLMFLGLGADERRLGIKHSFPKRNS